MPAPSPSLTDYIVAFCTVAIVGATIWQMCYVRTQTANLRVQTDLLYRAMQLTQNEQRAWVGITAIQPNWDVSPPMIKVVLTNRGNSPALKVRHEVRLITKPLDEPFCCDDITNADPIPKGSTTALLPGASYNVAPGLTQGQAIVVLQALQVGHRDVYLFGWIEYQDVFERCHRTTFARYALDFPPVWAHTDFYNEMD